MVYAPSSAYYTSNRTGYGYNTRYPDANKPQTQATMQTVPASAAQPVWNVPSYQIFTPLEPEPREIRARHILVKTRAEAEWLRRQLATGQNFETLARQYSQCPSRRKGGDLGFFSRGEMVPEFDEAAFRLPPGIVSKPVQTEFGWHLIQVTKQRF